MLIKLAPYILHISNKTTTSKEKLNKDKKCLHYFLLCFLFLFNLGIRSAADIIEYICF